MDGRVEGWMERWIDMGMDEWMGRSMESLDRLMAEMLALLQSGEHHGSRQKADS